MEITTSPLSPILSKGDLIEAAAKILGVAPERVKCTLKYGYYLNYYYENVKLRYLLHVNFFHEKKYDSVYMFKLNNNIIYNFSNTVNNVVVETLLPQPFYAHLGFADFILVNVQVTINRPIVSMIYYEFDVI